MILRESSRDWLFVSVVILLSIGANLSSSISESYSIDQRVLMATLIGIVVISLIKYLRITLILTILALAIGANLPDKIALEFGINKTAVLAALFLVVVLPILNKLIRVVPTGNEVSQITKSSHGLKVLFANVKRGNKAMVQTLIKAGVNINGCTVSGVTPLMVAAQGGCLEITKALIVAGARVSSQDSLGRTALVYANDQGFHETVAYLEGAGSQ